jgi:hypothetical protein
MAIRGKEKAVVRPTTSRNLGVTPAPLYIFDGTSHGYLLRYRIVSEDSNRFSSWSPIYKVEAEDPLPVLGEAAVSGNIVQFVWEDVPSRPQYDVFISLEDGPYEYHGTTPIHSYSIVNEFSAEKISAIVQVESVQKIYFPSLVICEIIYEEVVEDGS